MRCNVPFFEFNSVRGILIAAAVLIGVAGCSERKPAGPPETTSGAATQTSDTPAPGGGQKVPE